MVRGGRVPDCQVEISYLRGKKDLVIVNFIHERIEEVNCCKKTVISTSLKRRAVRKAKRRES